MSPIPLNGTRIAGREFHECVICKKASKKTGTTTVTLERGCLTMVVKCVPALVCPNCGEAYISESVTAELLKDAEERARTEAQVEIQQYVAA
jgi:YgiT-type zinc finger domain-containing protein